MPDSLLRPLGVTWVGLFARHLPTLVDFYGQKVGFRIVEQHDDGCIFDAGGGALFEIWGGGLACATRKSAREQSMRVGFLVQQLEPVIQALQARGLSADTQIESYLGTRWVYFTDPEGNCFEFKDCLGQ